MKKFILVVMMGMISMGILVGAFMWAYSQNGDRVLKATNAEHFTSDKRFKVSLYFANKEYSNILSETRDIFVKSEADLPEIVLTELLKGPIGIDLRQTLPEGTRVLDVWQEGTVAIVNFSKEYQNTMNNTSDIVARFSIVKTLSELRDIRKVKILVEGKELVDRSGQPLGVLGKDDIVFRVESDEKNKINLKLYFADNNSETLVAEEREVLIKDSSVERLIIQELIKGPTNKSLSKTVPFESKLIKVETQEGTCFINFSQELKTRHWGGSTGEIMTIYSIVNSLTELPHIKRVQFLIEGQKVEVFNHMIFNEPFVRDARLIRK